MAKKYLDNKKFFEEMVKYVDAYNEAVKNNKQPPVLNDYIGDCFLKIATNLSKIYKFNGYRFKEEMISDGYFDCIRYAHNFNPEKTKNPFGYYTQICYYAFVRKIQKEKKHLYTKFKAIDNSEVFGLLHTHFDADDMNVINDIGYSDSAKENMYSFISDYERKVDEKKKKGVKEDD